MTYYYSSDSVRHAQSHGDWVGPDLSLGFYTYGLLWEQDRVSWYVDGIERRRIDDSAIITDESMYIIVNLRIRAEWPGYPDDTTPLPARLECEYVRVYQRKERMKEGKC
jgi:beta-glucanase (GH16 family)